jgi:hypothetical protein
MRVPGDPEALRISALVPSSVGTFTELLGTVAADGTFAIPQVPPGTFYLRIDYSDGNGKYVEPFFIVTSERKFDLGAVLVGRPDAKRARTQPTTLEVKASGLSWQPDDELELYSREIDGLETLDHFGANEGDSEVTAAVDLSESWHGLGLVEGDKGDQLIVIHKATAPAGTSRYQAARGWFTAPAFNHQDGAQAMVSGTLQPLPQQNVSVTWNQAALAALASDVNSGAKAGGHYLRIYAEADPARGALDYDPELVTASFSAEQSKDQRLDLAFGNPFSGRSLMVSTSTSFKHPDSRVDIGFYIGSFGPLDTMTRGPIAVTLTPPRALRVEGAKVSWDPPAVGSPTGYEVTVYEKDDMDLWWYRLRIWTAGRSVILPPGLIEGTGPHVIQVQANNTRDPRAPFRDVASGSYAETVSETFGP